MGWSPHHASTMPLVLNLETGSVSPQFHIVFDDWFSTVSSSASFDEESIESNKWTKLLMSERLQVLFDETDDVQLDDEWLTEIERLERHQKATARVLGKMPEPVPLFDGLETPPTPAAPTAAALSPQPPPSPPTAAAPLVPPPLPPMEQQREPSSPLPPLPRQQPPTPTPPPPRRVLPDRPAKRHPKGFFKGMVVRLTALMAVTNDLIVAMAKSVVGSPAAYAAMSGFCAVTETFDSLDHVSFQALLASSKSKGKKGEDPNYPTVSQALSSPDADEWMAAMQSEVQTLVGMSTWTVVLRAEALAAGKKVIKSTWALRQKRAPDGSPTKKKARFCVRGDLQKRWEDSLESFSPVVQWSSVRLMLILSIVHGLETRQVNYVNAFAQAD